MKRSTSLLAVAVLAACNLPTDSESARDRLADRTETTGALTVPFPLQQFDQADYLARGDAKLAALIDASGESLVYPTDVRDIEVANTVTAVRQAHPVRAADFGPGFPELLELVRLTDTGVQLEVENTGDEAATLEGVSVALINSAGKVVQRAFPATASTVVPGKSKHTIDVPATELANLLIGDIALGKDVQISFDANRISIHGGGTARLRTRATVHAPIVVELGSREVHVRRVIHEQLNGDEEWLRQLDALIVDSAWIDIDVNNALPIALRAAVTIAPTPEDTAGFDPATAPDRIVLPAIEIEAARTKADGSVTARGISHVSLPVSAATIDLLRTGSISLAADVTIKATADRVKITHNNAFDFKASGRLRVKHKGRR